MATTPYFIIGPNTLLSVVGLLRGPDRTVPTPVDDWRSATVDVVIPALNEEATIALCLASVARQTMRPRQIILIDDGSRDRTVEFAKAFCELHEIPLIAISRAKPIGKTPTLKRQAREFDADVEFILDGDTILESETYIERTVQELYQGVGIACACGTILPIRDRDRRALAQTPEIKAFLDRVEGAHVFPRMSRWHRFQRALTNLYRGALYMFLQRFVYLGQMVFFGGITNPVGCAVAYRRKYVKNLFDYYEPIMGDDLTNSEDIFIGFAFMAEGYRNIQVTDVYARSQEPEVSRLPRQWYLWGSAFLQSCYYFDDLVRSPFKAWRRRKHRREVQKSGVTEKREIKEQYRQAFGRGHTATYGRPIGWVLLMSSIEKIFFPTTLLVMLILQLWEPLLVTMAAETTLNLLILTWISEGRRAQYFLIGVAIAPFRYVMLLFEFTTMLRFAADLWIFQKRDWRK